MSRLEELEEKINKLEEKRIAYLEVDNNASARKIRKQIENIELEIEILALNKIKTELKIYKEVVRDYPSINSQVKQKLRECQNLKKCA